MEPRENQPSPAPSGTASRPATPVDPALLNQVVQLAGENGEAGELPFGAFVVRDGTVIGTGVNTALRDLDPTAHAEVAAIRDACKNVGALHLTGATVVSSCEPCAVCHSVAASVGVTSIVYAAPKELIPDLSYPAPGDNAELMATMQTALRTAAPEHITYVRTDGADVPFARYLTAREQK